MGQSGAGGDAKDEHGVPFNKATKFRDFKLVVEGKSIFVNPYFLGEMSPFFETLCFGDFKEGWEREAELKDVKYDDVIEMLPVLGADFNKIMKKIDASNCVAMITVADRWTIEILLKRCIEYIETKFASNSTTISFTLELLLACQDDLHVGKKAFRIVASRLASFEPAVLLSHEIDQKINDPSLCAAVFLAAERFWSVDTLGLTCHVLARNSQGLCTASGGALCATSGCGLRSTRKCRICKSFLCISHAHDGYPCAKRTTAAGESSTALAPLDERFFVEETAE